MSQNPSASGFGKLARAEESVAGYEITLTVSGVKDEHAAYVASQMFLLQRLFKLERQQRRDQRVRRVRARRRRADLRPRRELSRESQKRPTPGLGACAPSLGAVLSQARTNDGKECTWYSHRRPGHRRRKGLSVKSHTDEAHRSRDRDLPARCPSATGRRRTRRGRPAQARPRRRGRLPVPPERMFARVRLRQGRQPLLDRRGPALA